MTYGSLETEATTLRCTPDGLCGLGALPLLGLGALPFYNSLLVLYSGSVINKILLVIYLAVL